MTHIKIKAIKNNSYKGDKSISIKKMNYLGQYETLFNVYKTSYGYNNDRYGRVFKTLTEAKLFASKI